MRSKLLIRRGGLAEYLRWDADSESMVGTDVTDRVYRHLFSECELEDGVTLRDLLLLVQRNIAVFEQVLPYWCREFVEEGLSGRPPRTESGGLEFLELSWNIYYSSEEKAIGGWAFPAFEGWGPPRDDYPGEEATVNYSLMASRVNDLVDLPVRLRQEVSITDSDARGDREPLIRAEKCDYTLGQALFGVIWELSWFGPPEERDKQLSD